MPFILSFVLPLILSHPGGVRPPLPSASRPEVRMADPIARNRRFLRDLFAGPFCGHAIIMTPEPIATGCVHDIASSDRPLAQWVDWGMKDYEAQLRVLEEFDCDGVPHARVTTGTQIFAAAFGAPVHVYEDSLPCALPAVTTVQDADRLETPDVHAPPLDRLFEFGRMMRERLGSDVPIRVPDIQSPFDIAALVWRKQDFYVAIMDDPEAVRRLVGKCLRLLTEFLQEWMREFGEVNLAHCPHAWAPPELGCWLSEDEAGAMSAGMFEEFCLPSLVTLSETFGGMFIHCCATADHQYESFKKVPNLRGMNRVFQAPGPQPAIEAFSGHAVLMQAWMGERDLHAMLDMALPDTRFLFNVPAHPPDEARRVYEGLRERCPRATETEAAQA